jgi:vacuolar-type H+-ATPase subunit H
MNNPNEEIIRTIRVADMEVLIERVGLPMVMELVTEAYKNILEGIEEEKESIKKEIIDNAFNLCAAHQSDIAQEFKNIDFVLLSSLSRQIFETACKNKRTLESLHNAVDTEVAAIKIKLDDLARRIRKNLTYLPDDISLFLDLQLIITKTEDDFKLLVESRLTEQKREVDEAAQRAIAEAKAKEEAEAARIAQEKLFKVPEPLVSGYESLLITKNSSNTKQINLTGFDKWWLDVGQNLTGDRMFLAKSAWDYAKSLKQESTA